MDPVRRDQRTKVKQKISFQTGKGLDERTIKAISEAKDEPGWMLEKRLKAYRLFLSKPMPSWGPDLSDIDLDKITFYLRPDTKKTASWDEVPKSSSSWACCTHWPPGGAVCRTWTEAA